MAFQKSESRGYMETLDRWSEEHIITPLLEAWSSENEGAIGAATEQVKRAIREKTLESYHNGQAVGPRKAEGK